LRDREKLNSVCCQALNFNHGNFKQ
jgi:hypothetical protein